MGIKPVNLSVGVKTLELGLTAVDLKLDFNRWICTRQMLIGVYLVLLGFNYIPQTD